MQDCADCAGRRAVVQPDVARAKINRARSWLDEADAILGRPRQEYLADARGRDLAAFYLFLAIQECIEDVLTSSSTTMPATLPPSTASISLSCWGSPTRTGPRWRPSGAGADTSLTGPEPAC